jgi:hypothetical protein
MDARDRYDNILRAQAREAEVRSAEATPNSDIAIRNVIAADELRALADNLDALTPEELAYLDTMTDDAMRDFAKAVRLLAGRDDAEEGDA